MKWIPLLLICLLMPLTAEGADHYFIGDVDDNWQTIGNWSASTGGGSNGTIPTDADDVYLDANSPSCQTNAVSYCANFDCTGFINALDISWNDYIDVWGSIVLVAGMTFVQSSSNGWIQCRGTGAHTITTGGKDFTTGIIIYSDGGSYTLQDALTCTGGIITLTKGTFDTNDQTVSCAKFSSSNANTRTLDLGASVFTCTGSGGYIFDTYNPANLTVDDGTSNIVFTGANPVFRTGNKEYYDITTINTRAFLVSGASTFHDISFTGAAFKDPQAYFNNPITVNNAAFNGNSATNRILIRSSVLGTARTITNANAITGDNVDFRDITVSTASDLSGGSAGDCGGNTDITFTTAADQYWHVDSGTWSDPSKWFLATNGGGGAGRVPLPQDTAKFDANSFDSGSRKIDQDMPRIGSVDWTGTTDTPEWEIDVGTTFFGSLTLVSGMTFDQNGSVYFEGRGSYTLTSAGKVFQLSLYMRAVGGTLTLQDAFSSTSYGYLQNGVFDANDQNVTFNRFDNSNNATRTLSMGSGTWTLTGTGAVWWGSQSGNLTLNEETSTILISNTSASAKQFTGGGQTYYNLTITGGGSGTVDFMSSDTFNVFTIGKPKTVRFDVGDTITVSSFIAVGDAGNGIVITSDAAGAHDLSDSAGENKVEYCTISYSEAGGGADWIASTDDGNTDSGNNSGWDFSAGAPASAPQPIINIF